jgi:hypothetical protein
MTVVKILASDEDNPLLRQEKEIRTESKVTSAAHKDTL